MVESAALEQALANSGRAIRRRRVHLYRPRRHQQQHLHAVARRQGAVARRRPRIETIARRHRPGIDRRDRPEAPRTRSSAPDSGSSAAIPPRPRPCSRWSAARSRALPRPGRRSRSASSPGCASARSGSSCRPRRNATPSCRTHRASPRSADTAGGQAVVRALRQRQCSRALAACPCPASRRISTKRAARRLRGDGQGSQLRRRRPQTQRELDPLPGVAVAELRRPDTQPPRRRARARQARLRAVGG